jgi:hypothetical protein
MQNRASYKQEGCLSACHRGVKNIFERGQYDQTKRQICFLKFKFRPRLLFIFTFEFINVLFFLFRWKPALGTQWAKESQAAAAARRSSQWSREGGGGGRGGLRSEKWAMDHSVKAMTSHRKFAFSRLLNRHRNRTLYIDISSQCWNQNRVDSKSWSP